jgi:PiT family inorganic phosphate transporter
MTDITLGADGQSRAPRPALDDRAHPATAIAFLLLLAIGVAFTAYHLWSDVSQAHVQTRTMLPFLLLGLALLIALGFEFVNGFHDTANAVATVIYTHSLPPLAAVFWSGLWNFLGVLFSTGAVAFGIVSLLPVELILQVGSGAGFAMVFALLIAAIIWNLGTWYFGLPASSSHTLIGSIIGVGLANQLMANHGAASGVDWVQALNVGKSLLVSPLVGFAAAALLLIVLKLLVRRPELYREPKDSKAPPLWIRGLLVLTCTGVSFAHGSNDGQKGMGLIMLILIGIVPTAYALNRAMADNQVAAFHADAMAAQTALKAYDGGVQAPADPHAILERYLRERTLDSQTLPALGAMAGVIGKQVQEYGSLQAVPAQAVQNVRNDMYLASETLRRLEKSNAVPFDAATGNALTAFHKRLDDATKYIPDWVKVSVAIALGLGTMVGWKRIVVTVGEKIGKQHLTYAQGASAELVAMATIGAADVFGLPVSTTHVLSSGVAGTMAANGSGLQMSTVRNLLLAWVLTLPAAILLAGGLYMVLRQLL